MTYRNVVIATVTLADFENDLELNGLSLSDLSDQDVARLRDIYLYSPIPSWKDFEAIALAVEAFAATWRGRA